MNSQDNSAIRIRIAELREEHRALDLAIGSLGDGPYVDQLQVRRLKKRKLQIKDQVAWLENLLIPDEPA